MALVSAETLAKSAGDVYLATYPEPAPTAAQLGVEAADIAVLEALGWEHMGWIHSDGPELANFEGETTKHLGWNRVAPIRTVTRVGGAEITVPFLQWNVETAQSYFLGSTFDVGTLTLTIPEEGTPVEKSMLLVVADGDSTIGLWIGKVTGRPGGSLSFPDGNDDFSAIPVTFDVLSATPYMKVIGVDVGATS